MKILYEYNKHYYQHLVIMLLALLYTWPIKPVYAQEAECAEVKIVIEQKLSFERQAFDAKMVINNGLTSTDIKDIKIELLFLDKNNQPVAATQDPNATDAKFFYKIKSLSAINSITGDGLIAAKSSAEIHWLIIPAYGTAETANTLYYIGAKVIYTLNGQTTTVDVTPDYIVVKPQPMLTLDYFFPTDVEGDDPFTTPVEPSIPFTLGVRIKNTGEGPSYKTTIESAQPKIVENKQNLLVNFEILNGYIADKPVGKSLLLNFGDIKPNSSKVGRWSMVTSLAGKFLDFEATFSHDDSLGGAVTSLIKDVKTHTLVHDVKVDLAGRDNIQDFLALDGDILRVYESEGIDSEVMDQSVNAQLDTTERKMKMTFPATSGFVYVKLNDPSSGTQELDDIKRSDGKILPKENFWFSKIRNDDLSWSYFINLFDNNSTGIYSLSKLNKVIGTDKDSVLYGTNEDDYLEGKAGNDKLYGRDGDDILLGGSGNDLLYGEDGNDRLEAGEGDDQLYGGNGNDTLVAGPGNSYLEGGIGDDTYIIHKGDGLVRIKDWGNAKENNVVIFEGLNSTDINSVELPNNSTLVINFTGGDQVIFEDRTSPYNQLSSYQFADGVSLTTVDILTYNPITLTTAGTYTFTNKDDHITGTDGNDTIYSYGGDDYLDGKAGNDRLYGGEGNDTLLGGSGNDLLYGENGNDRLEAGEGDDQLYGGNGNDTLVAGPGNSYLEGGIGDDTYIIHKGDGLVRIKDWGNAKENNVVIFEGLNSTDINSVELPNNSTLVINFTGGDQVIFEDRTSPYNQLSSYQFADGVSLTTVDILTYNPITLTTAGTYTFTNKDDHITGTDGNDTIYSYGGDDYLDGKAGNDRLYGGEGNDTLLGGSGNDLLYGENGNDRLEAGEGDDQLYGGNGNDTLVAGPGNSYLEGGIGDDTYIIHKGDGLVRIKDWGNAKENNVVIFEGLNSTDINSVELPNNSTLVINFTGGDQVIFEDRTSPYNQLSSYQFADGVSLTTVDILTYNPITLTTAGTYTFTNKDDHITGTDGNDTIYSYGGDDYLDGKAGNDRLYGGEGNDTLLGGSGNDLLYGENGNDRLEAGEGDDQLYGGNGNDTLVAGPGNSYLEGGIGDDTYIIHKGDGLVRIKDWGNAKENNVVIFEGLNSTDINSVELPNNSTLVINFTGGDQVIFEDRTSPYNQLSSYQFADGVSLTTVDILTYNPITLTTAGTYTFTNKDDHITGTDGNDTIYSYGGDDYLDGKAGNDRLYGGEGNDTLLGGSGNDLLYGENGNDRLEAGEGDDQLYGGNGNDTLVAGPGNSYLEGGIGDDTYIIHKGDGLVRIKDWGNAKENNVVIFEGLNSTDINSVELPNNSTLVINFTGGDQVIFEDRTSPYNQLSSYQFADGVSLTTVDILTYNPITLTTAGTYTFTNKDDHITGTDGNDTIYSYGGDDYLDGKAGNDRLYGGEGNDTLLGGSGNDLLYGENGNDRLEAGEGDDQLYGGNGNDTLVAGPGNSYLEGGIGDDTYIIHKGDGLVRIKDWGNAKENNVVIFEGLNSTDINSVELPNNSTLVINFTGGDQVIFEDRTSPYNQLSSYQFADGVSLTTVDILTYNPITLTTAGTYTFTNKDDHITGTDGNDTIYSYGGDDYLDGKAGNDRLYGGEGNDTLLGGSGNDLLYGENGNDRLEAGEGDDQLYGGNGNDTLVAGPGNSYLEGGIGDDTYIIHKGDGLVRIKDWGNAKENNVVIFEGLNSTDINSVELPNNSTLVINFTGGDQVIFEDRTSPYNQLSSYQFADGVSLTTEDLIKLIH